MASCSDSHTQADGSKCIDVDRLLDMTCPSSKAAGVRIDYHVKGKQLRVCSNRNELVSWMATLLSRVHNRLEGSGDISAGVSGSNVVDQHGGRCDAWKITACRS